MTKRGLATQARALTAAAVAAVLAAAAGAAATPQRGGTVVIARPPIVCLNPFGPCNLPHFDPALTQVLEGAFEVGPDLVFRPNLVSGVKIGRKPFTLTYQIRPQARWNDGVRVSSADFGFTYRTFSTVNTPAEEGTRELYAKIRRFRELGPKTFVIELREPFADWRTFFDVVLPRHALTGEDLTAIWRNRVDNPKTGRPIGNGPFLVSGLEVGRRLVLVRNPSYWGPHKAHLDRFVFSLPTFNPADPLGPLRRNEVDFTATPPGFAAPLTAELAAEARRIPGWRVVAWPALANEHLAFRVDPGGHPALRSRLVRQAIAYGIDRVEIARRANADLGAGAKPLDSTVFLASEQFYRPNWSVYRYDPARSRRLLEQAGCRRGADGVYSCAGERLRLRFFTTAGSAGRELALQLMRTQLRPAGIEIEPIYAPSGALFGTILPGGNFDAVLFGWGVNPGGTVMPETKCGDLQNWTGYCNRLAMRDLQQADRILAPALRARALDDGDRKVVRDVPALPLFQGMIRVAVKNTIRGFEPGGTHFNFFQKTEDWWIEQAR